MRTGRVTSSRAEVEKVGQSSLIGMGEEIYFGLNVGGECFTSSGSNILWTSRQNHTQLVNRTSS